MKKRLIVENDLPRLDAFLSKNLTGFSRAFLKDMIGRGQVQVDGAVVDADEPVREGQRVEVELPESASASNDDFESWVLYEDKCLLVLNKPSGLLMHPLGDSWLKSPEAARAGPPNQDCKQGDRKSTRLNSSHNVPSRMPSSA